MGVDSIGLFKMINQLKFLGKIREKENTSRELKVKMEIELRSVHIPFFSDRFQISPEGKMFSVYTDEWMSPHDVQWISPHIDEKIWSSISKAIMYSGGRHLGPPPPGKLDVNHMDGNKRTIITPISSIWTPREMPNRP